MRKPQRSLSSTRLIRSFNVVSVLRTMYREGGCSKAEIAQLTRMSSATVTRIISNLLEQGVVAEDKIAESTGGRKPVIFKLNYNKLYIVGIELVRDRVALAVCNLKGDILTRRAFRPYSLEPPDMINEIGKEFELLLSLNGINKEHILGIGLAISGIVNADAGILLRSVNLGWKDVNISDQLEEALGFPVVLENDANAAALAEFWFGRAKDIANFMYLKTDTGVGAGIMSEGRIMVGPRGMAGEIGHVPIIKDGRECACGQNGCLETYLYGQGLIRRYEQETGIQLEEPEDLFCRVASQDPCAQSLVNEGIEALITVISLAANMADLDLIVIGGLWGELGNSFLSRVEVGCNEIIQRSGLGKTLRVRGSALGENSDILGAVATVINRWFTPPI